MDGAHDEGLGGVACRRAEKHQARVCLIPMRCCSGVARPGLGWYPWERSRAEALRPSREGSRGRSSAWQTPGLPEGRRSHQRKWARFAQKRLGTLVFRFVSWAVGGRYPPRQSAVDAKQLVVFGPTRHAPPFRASCFVDPWLWRRCRTKHCV